MKKKKDFIVISSELFTAKTADIIEDMLGCLHQSAEEHGLNEKVLLVKHYC